MRTCDAACYRNITTQKTHDRLPIFLHENAIAILDKYKGEDFRGGRALPYMTNQHMNRCLKDLCEICEFNTPYTITYYKNGTRHDEVKPKYELIGTHAGRKTFIWESHRDLVVNERQRKIINMQFDGFFGKLTSGKWAKIGKCSTDTALNDIKDLVEKGILRKNDEGGRSTNYSLVTE